MDQLAVSGVLLAHVAMGVALAATAGLRAFLPPLVVGVAARLEWVPLPEKLDWLSSTPALLVFGVALAVELAGDKLPLIDHILDALATVVKPVAGGFVMWSVTEHWSPLYLTVIWIVLGGSLAGGVHVVKSHLRLASTAVTGGVANPVISVVEDLGAFVSALLAIAAPLLAALVLLLMLAGIWLAIRIWRRRAGPSRSARQSA